MTVMHRQEYRRRVVGIGCLLVLLCFCGSVWADDGEEVIDDAPAEDVASEASAEPGEEERPGEEADGTVEEQEGTDAQEGEEAQEGDEEVTPQQPSARLFVLPTDSLQGEMSEIVTQRINDSIRSRLGTLSGIELLPTFEALHGEASGDEVYAAIAEAERDYTSGIGLVNAGEYESAAETLQRSVTVLQENIAQLQNFGVLTDAMANLAIAYFNTGFDLDARDNIRHFAQLEPDAELDLDDYPELQALYEDEVERVEIAGTSTLNIAADESGAQVFINGELMGETPLTVEEFGFGQHFMVVRHGNLVSSQLIQVRGRDEEHDIEVVLADGDDEVGDDGGLPSFYVDLRDTFRTGQFGREMDPYLDELASQTGADYIAWTIVLRDSGGYAVVPFIYRVDDAMLMQGEDVIFNRELSNLRSRANQLSDTVAASVVHMPSEAAVDEVDLVPEMEQPVAAATPEEQPDEEVAVAPEQPLPVPDESSTPAHTPISEPMIDETPDDSSNTFMYLGLGGAAAGVIAGTVFMLVRSSESPVGFEAEVEW